MSTFIPVGSNRVVAVGHIVSIRKTLNGSAEIKLPSGEVVHAAAGHYAEAIFNWALGASEILFGWDDDAPQIGTMELDD